MYLQSDISTYFNESDNKMCFHSQEDYKICLEAQKDVNKFKCIDQLLELEKYCSNYELRFFKNRLLRKKFHDENFNPVQISYYNWKVNNLPYMTLEDKEILSKTQLSKDF